MRIVKLNKSLLKLSISDKDSFDALCFAMFIKVRFVSSTIKQSDIRYIKTALNMSSDRICKLKKLAVKLGYIRIENGLIIASKLTGKQNLKIRIKQNASFTKLKNVIREYLIVNHIRIQQKVVSLLRTYSNPKNLKEFQGAKIQLKKWGLQNNGIFDGLTYKRISTILNVSRLKAIHIINSLVERGKIQKESGKLEVIYKGLGAKSIFHSEFVDKSGYLLHKNVILKQYPNVYNTVCLIRV